ncbi:MAG: GDP-mannose 4,6-dehydratase [Candidatus Niyogibacteria bacterium]|nr:GDP-mannose 4,6-dehydratase [Candidatus Niyogibacteria bacterium]
MKALVTGGAGFIGSNLVTYLCDKGHEVVALDDFSSSGRTEIDKRAKLVRGSIGDTQLLGKLLAGKDVVFHLAATGIIKISLENPPLYFENNFMNGIKILDAMRKTGVKKIIYSSTAGVYGEPKRVPIRENDVKEPVNPYGAAKFAFEHALSAYYHAFGIESVSLRYFNVYGPGDEQRPVTRAVPSWIKAMLAGRPVPMYWQGKQKKDYIFVGDVVRANLLAAEKGKGCRVYNVAGGKGFVMHDIFHKLEKIMGRTFEIKHMGDRAGDPTILIAHVGKIKKELGWKPEVTLEEGLCRAVEYYRETA